MSEPSAPAGESGRVPLVSVIIATYNWSAALALAIRSVLQQTFADFELLVVGDACTDDSEAVVAAFADPRIRWFNLAANKGSQWAPNNAGIAAAAGRYIAYLGHDDLWWPTHLETLVAKAEATDADVVAGVTIMYGPPGSGVRAATGLFPAGEFAPRFFFPPSSMLHRRDLVARLGAWRSPEESTGAVDYDLLLRFHDGGARFAATGELTVFKFNAAWRRNAYKLRSVSEQAELLAAMARDGEALRHGALMSIVQAAVEDRFVRIEIPRASVSVATAGHRRTRAYKGASQRDALTATLPAAGLHFFVEEEFSAHEWHDLEGGGNERWRWTGPSPRSSFYLPVAIDRPTRLTLHINWVMGKNAEAALAAAELLLHDRPLPTRLGRRAGGGWTWEADLVPVPGQPIEMLTIVFPQPRRPLDLGINEDRRWLGMAVSKIELRPLVR